METINELELRDLLLRRQAPAELLASLLRRALDTKASWEERRPFWMYLYLSGHEASVAHALSEALRERERVPFDLLIEMVAAAGEKPPPWFFESLLKGLKKQSSGESLFAARSLDFLDKRLAEMRSEIADQKRVMKDKMKEGLLEKFWFLNNQRMSEQAGRVLRRVLELFPEDESLHGMKKDFEEQRAREVLANHISNYATGLERTATQASDSDKEMLRNFMANAEKICLEHREIAMDLAVAFYFMEDYDRALEISAWAHPSPSRDWLRAELLLSARRFVEALEHLTQLEVKYIDDPETTFAVSYQRAQALNGLGQQAQGLEIMQSIVRVRPGYRSAHALILEWSAGGSWE
ncbi:MAG TPA: hypothetical protein PKC28_14015 [Bdellovibrionales bacterium]|nr:hypothetical protein [Bdellovibrionales bacterium]